MKNFRKRALTSILSGLLLISMLASCGKDVSDASATTTTEPAATTTQTETATATDTALTANIPNDTDFKNHTFTFLIAGNIENNWKKNDIKADEILGEPVNDARYERNAAIEDLLNIKITCYEDHHSGNQTGTGNGYLDITKAITAGDYTYDAAIISAYDCANLAQKGMLYDLNSLSYLDLSRSWWDQKANEDLTINGKMYYTTGSISTAANDATCAILFNKSMVRDYKLSDPYAMVRDGSWTLEAMIRLGTDIPADLNNDGNYDADDRFAAIVWQDSAMVIVNACGVKCTTPNAQSGELELTLYNERSLNMFQLFADAFFPESFSYGYQRVSYDLTTPINMFSSNQSLYFMQLLDLVSNFRDTTVDFGILPYPKYDADQDRYYNTIGSWHSVFLCVPTLQQDEERTGIVLEAMAAESMKTVTPAYYEKTLVGKYIRDEESEDMLTTILESRVFDLGWFYRIGNYGETLIGMWRDRYADLTSRYKQTSRIAEKNLKTLNEAFKNN